MASQPASVLPTVAPLPLTLEGFRETYGAAFRDRELYPDAQVLAYLNLAAALLPAQAWADQLALGISMFVKHNLVLDRQADAAAESGGIPGLNVGPVSSKSVGGASISYDTSTGVDPSDGHWAMTSFGRRFINMCKIVGMGGAQIGGEAPIPGGWFPGSAAWYT